MVILGYFTEAEFSIDRRKPAQYSPFNCFHSDRMSVLPDCRQRKSCASTGNSRSFPGPHNVIPGRKSASTWQTSLTKKLPAGLDFPIDNA